MKKKNIITIIATAITLTLALSCMVGCGKSNTSTSSTELSAGGVLCLKVNPEIAVLYDTEGLVTKIEARNDDGSKILEDYSNYKGRECREVVSELVTEIGEAGYFVEEIDGSVRSITIEIENGSKLPDDKFLDEVIQDVKDCVNSNNWSSSIDIENESDYGITDYIDTDYGPDNDGVTDYDATDYVPQNSTATPAKQATTTPTQKPVNYDDTDYGPNNDGITDYNDTDYSSDNDSVTDYNDTDYGPDNDGVTDYNDTDYGPNNDGVTDYNDTDYGPDNDGVTDYNDTNYDDGSSDYDN